MASNPLTGGMDAPKAAGVITLGALVLLIALRKGFHGARVTVG